ncbi:phosphopantothenoylcysteine decarboxylase-like [Vigna radiata var. radiata]|uniref:phosphopantothenoylcysteine decarboxylase n=1 Tax=Vigna radiata var. radiata TaxID=3916 RepID=A0A1S3T906_VIGRR|nr:phosphopantothenoylcysteine decarboxylase-like [Vigna radiata var. radiata]
MMSDPNPASNIPQSSQRCAVRPRKPRILLGACGCTDAAKFALLCHFFRRWASVEVVLTRASIPFIEVSQTPRPVFFNPRKTASHHLEWADVFVIAPLSANTLAKIAQGICDNSLTEVVRGWDRNKPFYVAPAIDPLTWNNPLTRQYRKRCDELGINIIDPSPRGEMADPTEISYIVKISNEEIWD